MNKMFNEDCLITMNRAELRSSVDLVVTSPPYNMTKRKGGYADKSKRYDIYEDWKTEEDYIKFIVDVFNGYDLVLKDSGCVAFNFSYSKENPSLPYKMVSEICRQTNFNIVDTIVWKKKTAIPHPASKNRMRRVCEFVYIFSKKGQELKFDTNKGFKIGSNGQKYYDITDNFIEAKNNDGVNNINKATFSTELVDKILNIYAKPNSLVYDSFMGIGTTANSCLNNEHNFIGSEISKKQIDYYNSKI